MRATSAATLGPVIEFGLVTANACPGGTALRLIVGVGLLGRGEATGIGLPASADCTSVFEPSADHSEHSPFSPNPMRVKDSRPWRKFRAEGLRLCQQPGPKADSKPSRALLATLRAGLLQVAQIPVAAGKVPFKSVRNVGKGYTPAFIGNCDEVAERIGRGEDIVLVSGPDDTCAPLLDQADTHCHAAGVIKRDAHAAEALGEFFAQPVRVGERLRLCETMLARMREAFARGTSRRACMGFSWAPLCTSIARDDYAGARIGADEPCIRPRTRRKRHP